MNVLVTGSKGQVGSEIKHLIENRDYLFENANFFFIHRDKLDITNKEAIEHLITEQQIDTIINCAAYTAVDKAESEHETADRVNHLAVKNLADIAKVKDIFLIHISTDYVFNGKSYRPYVEDDPIDPLGVYGITKRKGEEAIIQTGCKSIIIRTSWVYSTYGHNFVKTMLKLAKSRNELGVIFDQVGTPTYARDLAITILDILKHASSDVRNYHAEIFHYSNEGVASWYDFAKAIFEIEELDIKVNPIETKDYPTPAKRPPYSILNKSKIKQEFQIEIPHWRESLQACLKAFKGEIR